MWNHFRQKWCWKKHVVLVVPKWFHRIFAQILMFVVNNITLIGIFIHESQFICDVLTVPMWFLPRGSLAISNPELRNSIVLGLGASNPPPESGNSILDTNTIKRELAFMGEIPRPPFLEWRSWLVSHSFEVKRQKSVRLPILLWKTTYFACKASFHIK